jgi:hypothetical protein
MARIVRDWRAELIEAYPPSSLSPQPMKQPTLPSLAALVVIR